VNVFSQLLDGRDDHQRESTDAETLWLRERAGIDPAERLQSWDRWLKRRLVAALVWPEAPVARERLLGQCAAEMTVLAKQLRGRGWLLDGKALAAHVDAVLAPIGKAQRAGKVGDFWPYFRAAVSRYVGANAEEIQHFARRSGADEGAQSIGAILGGLPVARAASMVELLADRAAEVGAAKAETLRARQARLRAAEAARRARASAMNRRCMPAATASAGPWKGLREHGRPGGVARLHGVERGRGWARLAGVGAPGEHGRHLAADRGGVGFAALALGGFPKGHGLGGERAFELARVDQQIGEQRGFRIEGRAGRVLDRFDGRQTAARDLAGSVVQAEAGGGSFRFHGGEDITGGGSQADPPSKIARISIKPLTLRAIRPDFLSNLSGRRIIAQVLGFRDRSG
jgi:hypothetical protein